MTEPSLSEQARKMANEWVRFSSKEIIPALRALADENERLIGLVKMAEHSTVVGRAERAEAEVERLTVKRDEWHQAWMTEVEWRKEAERERDEAVACINAIEDKFESIDLCDAIDLVLIARDFLARLDRGEEGRKK